MSKSDELTAADRRKLQRLINITAQAHAKAHFAENELSEFCLARYGAIPGDVDADGIIDSVLGGCGAPRGMSADEFDAEMRAAKRAR